MIRENPRKSVAENFSVRSVSSVVSSYFPV